MFLSERCPSRSRVMEFVKLLRRLNQRLGDGALRGRVETYGHYLIPKYVRVFGPINYMIGFRQPIYSSSRLFGHLTLSDPAISKLGAKV